MSTSAESPAIRPRNLSTRIEEEGDVLTLNVREGSFAIALFMMLWLTGWTVGCVALLWAVLTQRQPFLILFAIPFWISWIFVAGFLASLLFGRRRLVMSPEGLIHERRVLITLSRCEVPLAEIRQFRVRLFNTNSDSGPTSAIEAATMGRSLTFGSNLSALERSWLIQLLQEHLRRLQSQAGLTDCGEGDLEDCRNCTAPADSTWKVVEGFGDLTFEQRGRFSLGTILGLLFISGFWNGIVGVFVAVLFGLAPGKPMPAGIEWWGLFCFLIPFEAVGLVMFVGLLGALLEPFRVTRWRITSDTIERATTRLGLPLGWRSRYPCDSLKGVAVRDDLGSSWGGVARKSVPTAPTGEQYGLLLTDSDSHEICSIQGLTLGEARWMKGRIQEERQLR